MMTKAIERNRIREARFRRAERVLRIVRARVFDYDDAGLGDKAARVIATCKRLLLPRWIAQQSARAATYTHWMHAAE